MAEKRTTLKELIQDIDYRLTHLEDISADNRALIVKMIKQGNQIVEFLKKFDVEEVFQQLVTENSLTAEPVVANLICSLEFSSKIAFVLSMIIF